MMQNLVLTFHGIGKAPLDIPDAELPYWIPEPDFLSFIAKAKSEAQRLGLRLSASFDDGNLSDLTVAAPALIKYGIPGLFFPCSGRIGRPGYLNAAGLRALVRQGFAVGSHGVNHLPWASLAPNDLTEEVAGSKAVIEAALGHAITSAAMPFGSYNRRVLESLRQAGYQTVYSSDPGFANRNTSFQYRWSYKQGTDFDLARLAKISRDPVQRSIRFAKHMIKSLR